MRRLRVRYTKYKHYYQDSVSTGKIQILENYDNERRKKIALILCFKPPSFGTWAGNPYKLLHSIVHGASAR